LEKEWFLGKFESREFNFPTEEFFYFIVYPRFEFLSILYKIRERSSVIGIDTFELREDFMAEIVPLIKGVDIG
jgi:hypothetical protein